MTIEVWSDFVCPFCYIGKRKLEKALSQFSRKNEVKVIFKAYELNPNAPKHNDKVGYEAFASLKGVSLAEAKRMNDYVTQMAADYDLFYQMDKAHLTSSFDAHRLAKWARTYNKEKALTEKFMDAYFTKGENLADYSTLAKLVGEVGLNTDEALNVLNNGDFEDVVEEEIGMAESFGIRGVPFFVFNRKYAISGAQPDSQFLLALNKMAEDTPKFESLDTDEEMLCTDEGCEI
ncbi:DsbA family oxidoreductase [Acholeplasma equirhinis]|uniref:DsbA family oxidoreductase n=1 Tax=Acholeplasma equirhinis TaxID=555393 RepID=UPI00197AD7E7|nr:DsbA family oxidoreductase [Acholeplasma equirhinis]MBN3490087.1 DsbA family oxidoreductase [Acholeplasma equirhinis]